MVSPTCWRLAHIRGVAGVSEMAVSRPAPHPTSDARRLTRTRDARTSAVEPSGGRKNRRHLASMERKIVAGPNAGERLACSAPERLSIFRFERSRHSHNGIFSIGHPRVLPPAQPYTARTRRTSTAPQEIRLRAELKCGRGLREGMAAREIEAQGGARNGRKPSIADWGISFNQSSYWQAVSGLSPRGSTGRSAPRGDGGGERDSCPHPSEARAPEV
jgi:hypothetical protein